MLLLVHGEVTDADVDLFDREAVFIDSVLAPLQRDFPSLKIVFEHITTPRRRSTSRIRGATRRPRSPPTTCSTTATPSSPAACARTTTACRCSSASCIEGAGGWPPPAAPGSSWAPTVRRTRRT
jgi:hypothetical protein